MEKIFSALRELIASGENAVLVSVIASSGSTPRGSGAKMLVCRDGSIRGTIGGGAVEYRSIALARQLHETKQSALRAFDLSSEDKCDLGMICGGNATVYFQYLAAGDPVLSEMLAWEQELRRQETDAWLVTAVTGDGAPRMGIYAEGQLRFMESVDEAAVAAHLGPRSVLVQGEPMLYIEPLVRSGRVYVFGGGHVAQALVPVLIPLDFPCVVLEDRAEFADPVLFPGARAVRLVDFSRLADEVSLTDADYVCIMTRGHENDLLIEQQVLRMPARYIGLIGSARKAASSFAALRKMGFSEAELRRIVTPIGLPIGGKSPQEIAISIAAQLIQYRSGLRRDDAKEEVLS